MLANSFANSFANSSGAIVGDKPASFGALPELVEFEAGQDRQYRAAQST